MQLNLFKKVSVIILAGLSLCSCSSNKIPQTGYDKYRKLVFMLLDCGVIDKGIKSIEFDSCSYVWITGNGTLKTDIKDVVYYETHVTNNYETSSRSYLIYFSYDDNTGYLTEYETSTEYLKAYNNVEFGKYSGTIGSLK